ncbi:MAG: hypothetical protein H6873_04960 [Hyphomicrobiaceae bacterium]|nr:hypothetical protein [Hyphomicrobiaceae bacterium]
MIKTNSVRSLYLAAAMAFGGLLAGPASAQDVDGALAALTRLLDASGYEVGLKDVSVSGDEITINKVRARLKNSTALRDAFAELDVPVDANGAFQLPAPLVIKGLHDSADGNAYLADKIFVPQMEFKVDDVDVTIDEVSYSSVRIPKGDPTIYDILSWVGGSSIGPITIKIDDVLAFEIAPAVGETSFVPSQGPEATELTTKTDLPSILFHLENAPEPPTGSEAEIVGTKSIKGYLTSDAYWSLTDGHLIIRSFVMGAEDFGQFSFSFDFTGVTPDVIEQLRTLSANMDPEDPASQQQMMEVGMGLASRGFFNSFTLRYDDYGVLNRAMTVMERDEGTSRQEMVKQMLSEMTGAMTDLQLDDLKNKLEAEITKFVNDPKNIELRIEPSQPLPLISFIGLASTPKVLVDSLGVTITANQ